jgi:hypothetical protein
MAQGTWFKQVEMGCMNAVRKIQILIQLHRTLVMLKINQLGQSGTVYLIKM